MAVFHVFIISGMRAEHVFINTTCRVNFIVIKATFYLQSQTAVLFVSDGISA